MMHNPNSLRVHAPLDLQPTKDLFDPDAAVDDISTSEDLDFLLDYPLHFTQALPNPHKRCAADALGKFGGGTSKLGHSKRSKGSEDLPISDRDTVVRAPGPGPVPALSTLPSPLPQATQPMVNFPPVIHVVHP
jgi:hypothetical protein